jgi:hypothetical protein
MKKPRFKSIKSLTRLYEAYAELHEKQVGLSRDSTVYAINTNLLQLVGVQLQEIFSVALTLQDDYHEKASTTKLMGRSTRFQNRLNLPDTDTGDTNNEG